MGDVPALGVVVMAYGTPAAAEDIEPYYTHIRRGTPPSAEQLAELTARYEAIGGISPLAERTEAQRAELQRALEERSPGCRVVLGQKHAAPFIEDAVAALAVTGVERVVGLVLAPHFSRASVGQYQERLAAAATVHGLSWAGIDSWHLEPAYLRFLTDVVLDGLARLPERTRVLFTAHSLPERALADDPYPDQLRDSAARVADAAGLDGSGGWSLCWQSAGRTAEPWRGPDVLDVIRDLAGTGRADGVLVCPQGFVSDHLEVVYDLDIEARSVAEAAGLTFARTRVLNDMPSMFDALADRVLAAAPA
ncbi:MAG: ferrochelatase [Acidimicrobiales bacterium]